MAYTVAVSGGLTGEIAALCTALCWTGTSLAFESAGKRIGSLSVNIIRLGMAFILISVYCWIARGAPLPIDAPPHSWLWLGASGLVGFTLGDMCLFQALVVSGSRVATLMMSLVPPLTALIGWLLLGETLTMVDLGAMALTLAGVIIVVGERRRQVDADVPPSRITPIGILLGVGGAVGQSIGLVLSKIGMQIEGPGGEEALYDPFSATQIRIIAGILGFAIIYVIIGWWPRVISSLRDTGAMLRVGLGATFGPFLGVSLSLVAVQHTSTGIAATIMAITPILIIPATVVVHKERVSARAVAGALLAFAGVATLFLA